MNLKKAPLEDFKVNVKLKLSALWVAVMFCYLYGDYFSFYVPNTVEGLISGKNLLNSPLRLFAAAVLMTIPALMIFLSLVAQPKLNRLLNILFGIIYTAIMVLIAIKSLATWWSFYVFLAIVESILTSLIAWYAWRWPARA